MDIMKFLAPILLAGMVLVLGWLSDRGITQGAPLSSHMKGALGYGSLFVLGMCYAILWQDELGLLFHWRLAWLLLIVLWGSLLLSVALWHRKRVSSTESNGRNGSRDKVEFTNHAFVIVPAVLLLVMAIGAAVEWEYIFEGTGRWRIGLLWVAGLLGSIVIARRNRRATVIIVMRGMVALLVVGAVAARTSVGLSVAVASVIVLLLLEKLWPVNSKT